MNTNKSTFKGDSFNLHIFHKGIMYENSPSIMFAPTENKIYPPVSKQELERLAQFILDYLENN